MKSEYFIKSKRLGFREWRESDFNLALCLWGDEKVVEHIVADGIMTESRILKRLKQEIDLLHNYGVQYWPIFLLETDEHIGCCGLRLNNIDENIYEIGFHIKSDQWGKGFASEASNRVIEYAFKEFKVSALYAGHNPDNEASKKLLLKLGFKYVKDEFYPPTGLNHPTYLLTSEDFEKANS